MGQFVCLSVGLLVTTMNPAEMADRIEMLFGVVGGVGGIS